jgi:hypothetical protein
MLRTATAEPGALVTVESRETAAQPVRICVAQRGDTSLGLAAAAKVLVRPSDKHSPVPRAARKKLVFSSDRP